MPKMVPVKSSNIQEIGYDAPTKSFVARFRSGEVYVYDAVDNDTFLRVLDAQSIGSAFAKLVKDTHRFVKVSTQSDADASRLDAAFEVARRTLDAVAAGTIQP